LFDWSDVTCATDITDMYNRFLAALSQLVHDNIPVNTVKLGVHDPPFVTPLIKQLLRKRNKLRRKSKLSQANELAAKINSLIVQERSRTMTSLADAKPKQFWAAVKPTVSSKSSSGLVDNPLLVNVDTVDDFFASISYDCNSSSGYSLPTNIVHNESDVLIRDYELEPYLRKITPTAPGLDALPSWLFAKCSSELAGILHCNITDFIFYRPKKTAGENWPCITITFCYLFHGSCKTAFMPLAACKILQQCRLQLVKLSRPFGLSLLRLFESFNIIV